jgi:hypothetical protein
MRTLSVGWHSGYQGTVAQPNRKCKPKGMLGLLLGPGGAGPAGAAVI